MTGTTELVTTFAGRLIRLDEADRFGGVGRLVVRVSATGGALDNPVVEWVRLLGTEVLADGGDGGELDVLVRAETLRAALEARGSARAS